MPKPRLSPFMSVSIGHCPLGIYEEADLSLKRSQVLERRYVAFGEHPYQEDKRCMLAFLKSGADFFRGVRTQQCNHQFLRPTPNTKTGAPLPGLRPDVDHAPLYCVRRFSLG